MYLPTDVDSSNTPDSSSSEPLVVVPDASKPEATDSQNQTDAVLNVEEEDQVDVNLTDSEKKPETTSAPGTFSRGTAGGQREQ